ncbi:hypothetical protein HDV64DRAFT_73427 [Trichoderma sp. TUCIM 5745]
MTLTSLQLPFLDSVARAMTDKDTPQKVNECRTARVAEVLADFRALQYYISAGPVEPENEEDYYTEGWAALRQCTIDGQYILDVAADTRVPAAQGGVEEQTRAELQQILLDAYARRHEGQKILLRQAAAQRWIEYRDQILQGQRPHPGNHAQLQAIDIQLRAVSLHRFFFPSLSSWTRLYFF